MEERRQWIAGALHFPQPFSCEIKRSLLKRVFDIAFSGMMIVLCSPILLTIALAIRYTSSGSIIYSQERVGRGGFSFRCYKFRTMYSDAETRLQEILRNDSQRHQEWEQNHKFKDDPRITTIGAFLRRTSLDELPQFWNVFKGDLSVVGPRPVVREEIVKHYGLKARKTLSIRPGITGLWQVSGRSDTCYATRIALDEQYVDNCSFLLDLKLIALTIPRMISRRGAY